MSLPSMSLGDWFSASRRDGIGGGLLQMVKESMAVSFKISQ